VIAKPFIAIRYGNAQWTSRSFEVWMVKWPRIIWSLELISSEAKRKRVKPEPWKRLRTLRFCRALGSYSRDMYDKVVAPSNVFWPWKAAALMIAFIPQTSYNAYMHWFLRTFKKHKVVPIYELSVSREKRRQACAEK
jgi:hypothetical protein